MHSALGLAGTRPNQRASSLTAGQQSNTGSIGLRTQSITIMRDALYRRCEAYNNGILGDVMVATLLGRSQDLTAVILAVEQLTGAVAANQVLLTGTTSANASANLVANEQALTTARNNLSEREAAEKAAKTKRDKAHKELSTARTTEEAADAALKAVKDESSVDANKVTAAESQLKRAQEDRQKSEKHLELAEAELKTKKLQLDIAKQVVETIKAAMDVALMDTATNISGSGQFSIVQPRKQLSDSATKRSRTPFRTWSRKYLTRVTLFSRAWLFSLEKTPRHNRAALTPRHH